jgi:hypothetical protein
VPYFRASGSPNDLTMLPLSQRDHEDLANIATNAEADVIRHFTKAREHEDALVLDSGLPTERYVWIRGYQVDPNDADVTDGFRDAMRRTIANVIRWRIPRNAKPANVVAESGDKRTKDYRPDAESEFPPGFAAPLSPFIIDSSPIYY